MNNLPVKPDATFNPNHVETFVWQQDTTTYKETKGILVAALFAVQLAIVHISATMIFG